MCIKAGCISLRRFSSQYEVRDPRQVWDRRTWVADRGVRCDRAHRLDKFSVAPLRLAHTEIGSVLSDPYLNWVSSVWSIPKNWSVSSGPYPIFGLLGLAKPKHRSVSSGPYPIFGLFRLAHTQLPVCSLWPISNRWSVSSGPYPGFGLFCLVHAQSSVFL